MLSPSKLAEMETHKMRKQPTEEQKARAAEKRERFKALLKQVAAMSDQERAALVMRAGAVVTCDQHALTPKNTILCIMQFPNVSVVGGFKQWLKQGRAVKKGEHGITIWIPSVSGNEETGETDIRFLTGTVFDISQTQEIAESEAA